MVQSPKLTTKRRENSGSSAVSTTMSTVSTSDISVFGESSIVALLSASRLYGREEEEEILRSTFERITSQKAPRSSSLVLISGSSGDGKTRLAESLRSHVASVDGYFCSGEYDQHQDDPFEPLCEVFNDYIAQLLQRS